MLNPAPTDRADDDVDGAVLVEEVAPARPPAAGPPATPVSVSAAPDLFDRLEDELFGPFVGP